MDATCGADARRDLGLHPALHVDQTRGCSILYHAATALTEGENGHSTSVNAMISSFRYSVVLLSLLLLYNLIVCYFVLVL